MGFHPEKRRQAASRRHPCLPAKPLGCSGGTFSGEDTYPDLQDFHRRAVPLQRRKTEGGGGEGCQRKSSTTPLPPLGHGRDSPASLEVAGL